MVTVEIVQPDINRETHQPEEMLLVRFQVEGNQLTVLEGDPAYGPHFGGMTVLDLTREGPPEDREMRLETHGEEWARQLPNEFRSGRIAARVTTDTGDNRGKVPNKL